MKLTNRFKTTKTNGSRFNATPTIAAIAIQLRSLQAQMATTAEQAKEEVLTRFAKLKEDAEIVRTVDPAFTFPWETYAPPADQRRYQVETAMDAVLKVLPRNQKTAITSAEILRRVKALHLSYADATIYQTLCNMRVSGYVDNKGFQLRSANNLNRVNLRGRPGSVYWKTQ